MEYSTIEKGLAEQERILMHTVGVSMEPLLHNRKSTVVLEKPKAPLQQGDVVLYHDPEGGYVLHRIIRVLNGYYRMRGDNCVQTELVPANWIIGVMTGFYENEKDRYVSCTEETYQAYVRTLPRRYHRLWLRCRMKKMRSCVKRMLNICKGFLCRR